MRLQPVFRITLCALAAALFGACGDNTPGSSAIGGTVSGLDGTGLVLQDNNGDDLAISANGTFTFATPVVGTAPYSVTVKTQPTDPSQTCLVANASGTTTNQAVTNVAVTCQTGVFLVDVTVTGLKGKGLVLENNLGDDLGVAADGTVAFATRSRAARCTRSRS